MSEKEEIIQMEETELVQGDVEEGSQIVVLSRPYSFEGKMYEKIDMRGREDLTATDMIKINRRLTRNGNAEIAPEFSLEFALAFAAAAVKLPVELFENLPPRDALQIKSKVIRFLYGSE